MAMYNEILEGRFARHLQRFFGIKGSAPTPSLSGDINATWDQSDPGVEDVYLQSIQRFGMGVSVGPTAAAVNFIRLRNPQGSNVVAVIEFFNVGLAANDPNLQYGLDNAAAQQTDLTTVAGVTVGSRFDPRGSPTPVLIVSTQTGGGVTLGHVLMTINQGAGGAQYLFHRHQEIPIFPGFALTMAGSIVNTTSVMSVFWRERLLGDGERQ